MTADELILGLGGNLGGDTALLVRFAAVAAHFAGVAAHLAGVATVRTSRVYCSAALTVGDPPFLNAALAIGGLGALSPAALVATLHALEAGHGRRREVERRWGPRPLDVDVLAWGPRHLLDSALTVPHPRLTARSFALRPMIDLLGGAWIVPGTGRTLATLARAAGPPIEATRYAIVFARGAGPALTTG